MAEHSQMPNDDMDNFYTLVPEQGLCLIGDIVINLRRIAMIRKTEGKTLIYCPGVADPIVLPVELFDQIKEAVFLADEYDDDDDDDDDITSN